MRLTRALRSATGLTGFPDDAGDPLRVGVDTLALHDPVAGNSASPGFLVKPPLPANSQVKHRLADQHLLEREYSTNHSMLSFPK